MGHRAEQSVGCSAPANRWRAWIASELPLLRLPVLANEIAFQREVWLVTHPDLKGVRRIRLLFEHLGRRLKQYVDHKGA